LGELGRRPGEVARVAIELLLEALEERQRVGHRPREARQNAATLEGAHLGGLRLDDGVADRDLPVAREGHAAILSDGEDGGAMIGGHECTELRERRTENSERRTAPSNLSSRAEARSAGVEGSAGSEPKEEQIPRLRSPASRCARDDAPI